MRFAHALNLIAKLKTANHLHSGDSPLVRLVIRFNF